MCGFHGSVPDRIMCPRQARSSVTSVEYWSGWAHLPAHLAHAENPQDVSSDNIPDLHSTIKWRGVALHMPLELTNFIQTSTIYKRLKCSEHLFSNE